jgi:hypothetical protein
LKSYGWSLRIVPEHIKGADPGAPFAMYIRASINSREGNKNFINLFSSRPP